MDSISFNLLIPCLLPSTTLFSDKTLSQRLLDIIEKLLLPLNHEL